MARLLAHVLFFALFSAGSIKAVETNGGYNTTAPTNSDIPSWTTGWGAANVTGWNYVGQIAGGASGVYVGNGWVLTAGHVGAGSFVLGNGSAAGTYSVVSGSAQSIPVNETQTVDVALFQVTPVPNLPALRIATSPPVAFSATTPGTMIALLGFGGSHGLTWGYDTITDINEAITPDGLPQFLSNDFLTQNDTVTRGSSTITNNSAVVSGDSGGGDFAFNPAAQAWELAGINEVMGADNGVNVSGYVQLNTYASQINEIVFGPATDTPTMPFAGLVILAVALVAIALRRIDHRPV